MSFFFLLFFRISFFLQGALALGTYSNANKGLSAARTKLIQRTIGLFFAVMRSMERETHTEEEVGVIVLLFICFSLMFFLRSDHGTPH
jgi:hypothetical protein